MEIRGTEKLTPEALEREIAAGGRFVAFEYCISLILVSLRRTSQIRFLHAHESGILQGLPYSCVTLLLGWWGIPWGLVYTPLAVATNLAGGRVVTDQVLPCLRSSRKPALEREGT